jgi:5'-nucleotidase
VSGVQVWYDAGKAPGKRITRTRLESGKSIDDGARYTLVVSDFMATGGSGFGMLAAAPREDLDVVDVDALSRYLGTLPAPVDAPADARFHRTDR